MKGLPAWFHIPWRCTGPATFAHRQFDRNTFSFCELSWISNFLISRPDDGQNPEDLAAQNLFSSRQVGHAAHYLARSVRHGVHARLGGYPLAIIAPSDSAEAVGSDSSAEKDSTAPGIDSIKSRKTLPTTARSSPKSSGTSTTNSPDLRSNLAIPSALRPSVP